MKDEKIIQAIHDTVIVQPDPTVERIGNIHIPESAQKTPEMGRVVSVGPQVSDLMIGCWIAYPKGHDDIRHIEYKGYKYIVMAKHMVLGLIGGIGSEKGRYQLRPLWDRVIIRRSAAPSMSAGGVHLVTGPLRSMPEQGIIIAVGAKQTELTVGQHIVYYQFGKQMIQDDTKRKDKLRPWSFTLDGKPHVLLAYEDVGGIIE